jgi:hypothetical protein
MTEEQQDAPYESTRDAGSTPATSTILPSVYGASGAIAKLLPDSLLLCYLAVTPSF